MSKKLEALVRTFVADLQTLTRAELSAEVSAAVLAALGGATSPRRAGAANIRPKSGKGSRRSAEEIAKQAEKVLGLIRENPGSRAEQLAKATGWTTGELVAPLTLLLEKKDIRKAGVARGTHYTAKG